MYSNYNIWTQLDKWGFQYLSCDKWQLECLSIGINIRKRREGSEKKIWLKREELIRNHELARKQREEEEGAEVEGRGEECVLMDPHPHPHLHSLRLLSPFIFPSLSLSPSSFSTHFIQIAPPDP